jgi:hypothetical protein
VQMGDSENRHLFPSSWEAAPPWRGFFYWRSYFIYCPVSRSRNFEPTKMRAFRPPRRF